MPSKKFAMAHNSMAKTLQPTKECSGRHQHTIQDILSKAHKRKKRGWATQKLIWITAFDRAIILTWPLCISDSESCKDYISTELESGNGSTELRMCPLHANQICSSERSEIHGLRADLTMAEGPGLTQTIVSSIFVRSNAVYCKRWCWKVSKLTLRNMWGSWQAAVHKIRMQLHVLHYIQEL